MAEQVNQAKPKTPHGCWQQRDAVALAIGGGDSDWRHKWSLMESVVDGKTYDKLRQASNRQATLSQQSKIAYKASIERVVLGRSLPSNLWKSATCTIFGTRKHIQ
uniref:Uncharacterized protein n=1 Tax=Glossina austeni TaxID=7395 RepID=A0A1A9VXP7_GLOAU